MTSFPMTLNDPLFRDSRSRFFVKANIFKTVRCTV